MKAEKSMKNNIFRFIFPSYKNQLLACFRWDVSKEATVFDLLANVNRICGLNQGPLLCYIFCFYYRNVFAHSN